MKGITLKENTHRNQRYHGAAHHSPKSKAKGYGVRKCARGNACLQGCFTQVLMPTSLLSLLRGSVLCMPTHGSRFCRFRIFLNKRVDDHRFCSGCILLWRISVALLFDFHCCLSHEISLLILLLCKRHVELCQ